MQVGAACGAGAADRDFSFFDQRVPSVQRGVLSFFSLLPHDPFVFAAILKSALGFQAVGNIHIRDRGIGFRIGHG